MNWAGSHRLDARAKLLKAELRPEVAGFTDGTAGHVVAQAPAAGLAARKGMAVTLVVGRG